MEVEVLLSVINLNKKDLENMNITSKCTIINQTDKEKTEKYKNYKVYSYNERGISKSRNRGLQKVTGDIILLCDNDIIYDKNYTETIIKEFQKNKKADAIMFNINDPYKKKRINKRNKRLHIYNSLNYSSCNIAFKKNKIKKIRFNTSFGSCSKYFHGEDSLFIVDMLKNNLKIYANKKCIGKKIKKESTWFKEYDEKFFFDKGALFTAISTKLRHLLIIQYLIRHREVLKKYNIFNAYKIMIEGSNDYLNSRGE